MTRAIRLLGKAMVNCFNCGALIVSGAKCGTCGMQN